MIEFQELYLHRDCLDFSLTERVCRNLPHLQPTLIDDAEIAELKESLKWKNDPHGEGKKILLIREQKGAKLHNCPGSFGCACCNYMVINLASNCPFDCSYCYLQTYLNDPITTLYANEEDFLSQISEQMSAQPKRLFRIGTGEIADSLALDPITEQAEKLVRFFRQSKNGLLELKTKSKAIDGLLNVDPGKKVAVSWSLSTPSVIATDEKGTASLSERLIAAKKCAASGYRIGFHLDPLVLHKEWQEEYQTLIDALFSTLEETAVDWISMGSLRYMPGLRELSRKRFPDSALPLGEFSRTRDAKERYYKPKRIQAYQTIQQLVRREWKKVPIFLCMESTGVWRKTFSYLPWHKKELQLVYQRRAESLNECAQ